jgi:hypothetical protein
VECRTSFSIRSSRAEEADDGRQHGNEVDERKEAGHVAQPAPQGIAVAHVTEINAGPEPQYIFSGKDCGCCVLEEIELEGKMAPDRLDGFEDDAGDVDNNQQRQGGIEQPCDAAARLLVLEDRRKLAAQIAEIGHAFVSPDGETLAVPREAFLRGRAPRQELPGSRWHGSRIGPS